MMDNYLLDIGDYVKFALLRSLIAPGGDPSRLGQANASPRSLGVLWYRTGHLEDNNDGMKLGHLTESGYDALDPELLAQMRELQARIDAGEPRVLELLDSNPILPGARYCWEELPQRLHEQTLRHAQAARRRAERLDWWERARAQVGSCEVVFADPDNGFMPGGRKPGAAHEDKSIRYAEVADLVGPADATPTGHSRVVVVYHHLDRTRGGWIAATQVIHGQLAAHGIGDALLGHLHSRIGTGRTFFVFARDPADRERSEAAIGGLIERANGSHRMRGKLIWSQETA